jgi:NAD(P)-dependent dehydrogenase (short-subunit alcohol dehydrogenase family)
MPVDETFRAVELIEAGRYPFGKLHTHSFPIEQAEDAIHALAGDIPGMNPVHLASCLARRASPCPAEPAHAAPRGRRADHDDGNTGALRAAVPAALSRELDMRLRGKIALITGGNSGIGLATARLFVAEGARVAIIGRNKTTLDAAAAELGDSVVAIQADVTDVEETERAVTSVTERLGKLDVVFANAGAAGSSPLGQTSLAAFEQIVRINLTASFFTVQAALPHLNDGASIVLNGSVHAVMGMPGYSAYAAAKGGVRSMTRNLASELAPRRIRVNQVTPGGTRTPIWSSLAPTDAALAAIEARISRGAPLGRIGEADEVAKAVLYLASDDASNVTGTEIVVDGGATGAPLGAPIFRAG